MVTGIFKYWFFKRFRMNVQAWFLPDAQEQQKVNLKLFSQINKAQSKIMLKLYYITGM